MHCTCQLCEDNLDHKHRPAHDFVRSVRNVLTKSEVSSCIGQINDREGLRESELASLCDVGGVTSDDLRYAKPHLVQMQSSRAARVHEIEQMIHSYSADAETENALMEVVNGQRSGLPVAVHIKIDGRSYSLVIPSTTRDGFDSLYEVFGQRVYEYQAPCVEAIYDLGAFIGISAVYLGSKNPGARLVCIEPVPDNLEYLRTNLALNAEIEYEVLPLAIGSESGKAQCNTLTASSMANSMVFTSPGSSRVTVRTTALAELSPRGRYGLKVDIEGAEFSMRRDEPIIRGAQWVIGELHFGSFSKAEDRWLRDLLDERFVLRLDPIRISKVGAEYLAAQNFQAL